MQSANRFGPLKGHCLQQALIGPNQATGLAGGFDFEIGINSVGSKNIGIFLPLTGGM